MRLRRNVIGIDTRARGALRPPKRARLPLLCVLSPALLAALAACSNGKASKPASGTQAGTDTGPPPVVVYQTVQPQTVPIYAEYTGETEAANTVEIHSQVQGFLQQIDFKEGSIVRKGQLLFVIDPRPYKASLGDAVAKLAVAQATLANAESVLKRYRPLAAEQAISKEDLQNAIATVEEDQASVESAQANVTSAQLNVNYTKIHAPMTGAIGVAQVRVGDLIQAGTTLMDTVYSISPIYVTFGVSEADYLAYVQRGRPHNNPAMQLILSDGDGYVYPHSGSINMVAPAVNTSTGTLEIRVAFPNPDNTLKPGLFARVRFAVRDETNAILVPQSAIIQLQGMSTVLVAGPDNKVQERTVTTGPTVGNSIVVASGLQGGDRVIVEGMQKVQPGMTVAPTPANPATMTGNAGKGQDNS